MRYFIQSEINHETTAIREKRFEADSHDEAIEHISKNTYGEVLHVWSSFQNKQPLARIAIVYPNGTFQRLSKLEAY